MPKIVAAQSVLISNITNIYSVRVEHSASPQNTNEVSTLVQKSGSLQVAIGGGRFSMGGQVAIIGGLHIDMRAMNRLVWLNPDQKTVRVQAGIRWRDLQDIIDPHNLAVKTMQSYSNFTVGGSVSVNCHGRYVGHGPIANTIRALQLVLANGDIVEATPSSNIELFRAVIGGYGALAVITEVELDLRQNELIERVVQDVDLDQYTAYFRNEVQGNKQGAILHNAHLLPPSFERPSCVTWQRAATNTTPTESARLTPRGQRYTLERNTMWALSELPFGNSIRKNIVQPYLLRSPARQWLNHEASLDVASLEPASRTSSTYALQEYFVPESQFVTFAHAMSKVLQKHHAKVLNVSIRHTQADSISLLAWATTDVFSFVIYYKQHTWQSAQQHVATWTRELIDLALACDGRYYLPYQLHATQAQFEQAYPEVATLRKLKTQYDPQNRFSNELWRKYL